MAVKPPSIVLADDQVARTKVALESVAPELYPIYTRYSKMISNAENGLLIVYWKLGIELIPVYKRHKKKEANLTKQLAAALRKGPDDIAACIRLAAFCPTEAALHSKLLQRRDAAGEVLSWKKVKALMSPYLAESQRSDLIERALTESIPVEQLMREIIEAHGNRAQAGAGRKVAMPPNFNVASVRWLETNKRFLNAGRQVFASAEFVNLVEKDLASTTDDTKVEAYLTRVEEISKQMEEIRALQTEEEKQLERVHALLVKRMKDKEKQEKKASSEPVGRRAPAEVLARVAAAQKKGK